MSLETSLVGEHISIVGEHIPNIRARMDIEALGLNVRCWVNNRQA
jgi:hypothetical protein